MKKFLIVLVIICFSSCKEKKTEFIKSNVYPLYLVKNIPKNDSILKDEIEKFVINDRVEYADFYEYTWSTSYFIDNEESSGFGAKILETYQKENGICFYYYKSCRNDSLKKVGTIRYYEKYGNFYEPDTIIGKCK